MSEHIVNPNHTIVTGIFEFIENKCGRLIDMKRNGKTGIKDPFIPRELVRRFKLKEGCFIVAEIMNDDYYSNPRVRFIQSIDGVSAEARKKHPSFEQLTIIGPEDPLRLEMQDGCLSNRIVDLFCPIGKGQRGLVVAPPRTGKTTLLQNMAKGVKENNPECHIIVLLIDERPEEVTDFKRILDVEIFASSNDEKAQNHIRLAKLAIERAKRLLEVGTDVVLFLDSLTRLARANNALESSSGKTMSGGLGNRALEIPRQIFSTARNTEEAGSITIIASALIETGSKMDDLIYQEFKGTGNMEIVLDRKTAELRLWPAINLLASGTRKEELLLSRETLEKVHFFRRALASQKVDDAAETLIGRLGKTKTNKEFLNLLSS